MDNLLTKKKAKWRRQFKPDMLRGQPLVPNSAAEARLYAKLLRLIDRMTDDTRKKLEKLFAGDAAQEYFAEDASISSQARILTNALIAKFDDMFGEFAKPIAEQAINETDKASNSSVNMSLKELSGGLTLPTSAITDEMKEILSAAITEGVSLIKSIPQQYLSGVQGAVMRSITTGNGLQDLVPYLEHHKMITQKRARLIARDQTRKAYSALNKSRMMNLGLEEYEWLHTNGQMHPRELHLELHGTIQRFDTPPIIQKKPLVRGIPGQLIHCACRMRPIIRFDKGTAE